MNIGTISNPSLKVKPSKNLYSYIKNRVQVVPGMPDGISNLVFKNKHKTQTESATTSDKVDYLITNEDIEFINKLHLDDEFLSEKPAFREHVDVIPEDKYLTLKDLKWLYRYITEEEKEKVYFHMLFEGSEIILPKNEMIPRSEQLEKRCQQIKNEIDNREYHRMVQKIRSSRNRFPEDTIAHQMKEMNKQIIAVFQFIVSVLAGFAFGFLGVELMIGNLDFGFRLLLGIIFALIIALAELYFLAKKLNEEVIVESEYVQRIKSSKLD